MKTINIINGPNINMLGTREPEIYGGLTLNDINEKCVSEAKKYGFELNLFQSNHEGDIVGQIQGSCGKYDAIIINAAAYTHTSVAIRDSLLAFNGVIIEVHISNIFKRESFRHHSYISDIAHGMITGFGVDSYLLAIRALRDI